MDSFIYTFACREEELDLCRMEQRALFGAEACAEGWLLSSSDIGPGRSPFLRQRLSVRYEATSLEKLIGLVDGWSTEGRTFKVRCMKLPGGPDYDGQRLIERKLGAVVRGKADVRQPELLLGVAETGGRWRFGELSDNPAVWLLHQRKPRSYSTALSTRVARAAVNLALPYPDGRLPAKCLLDPCCGIGTVLIEALSMGAKAEGSDLNPLAVMGANANLAHFGYSDAVKKLDIADRVGAYDALIVDLPYNLCSVSPPEEQLRILEHARRLSDRAVLIATEELDTLIHAAGYKVLDRCLIPKGKLTRQVHLCGAR